MGSHVRGKFAACGQANFNRNVILIRLTQVAPCCGDVMIGSVDAAGNLIDERCDSRVLIRGDHHQQQKGNDVAHRCVVREARLVTQDPARASFLFERNVFAHEPKNAFHRSEQPLRFDGFMTVLSQMLYQRPLSGNARLRFRNMSAGLFERCFGLHG